MRVTTLLFMALAQPLAVGQDAEPLRIHSTYLGQSVVDYSANGPAKLRLSRLNLASCSKESNKNDRGPSDRDLCNQLSQALRGEKVVFRLSATIPGYVRFEHGKIAEFVELILPSREEPLTSPMDKVLVDLKPLIGEPQNTAPIVKQNSFGAKFTFRTAGWTLEHQKQKYQVLVQEEKLNGLPVVYVTVSSRTKEDRERELAEQPSTLR